MSRRLARVALAGWAVLLGTAAVAPAAPRPIRFERILPEDGLSQGTVLAIHQDRQGFVWLGTEDGLNRFDGRAFLHLRHERGAPAEAGLASSYVRAIAEDSRGDLWIATEGGGVVRFDPGELRFERFRHDPRDGATLATDDVREIHVDADDVVWVGTRGRGLQRIDPATGRVARFVHDPADPTSLNGRDVLAIASDGEGRLWVGTEKGLNRFEPARRTFVRYESDPSNPASAPADGVRAITEDAAGDLWLGTLGSGLARRDRHTGRFEYFTHDPARPDSLPHDTVRSLLVDNEARLWVGTVGGLALFDRETASFWRYAHEPADPGSLSRDDVMELYQDRAGLLWVGTQHGGVNTWNPRTWSFGHVAADPARDNSLSDAMVSSFAMDARGALWVGTVGGGLNRFDNGSRQWTHFRADPSDPASLASDYVMALLYDSEHTLWIGTMDAGLARYDPTRGGFRTYRHDPDDVASLSTNAVMSLFEDRDGSVWIGTFGGGACRFDRRTGTFERFAADPDDSAALASSRITAFAQDPAGNLYVGSDGGGLHLFDPVERTFRRYAHDPEDPSSLAGNTVYALHLDSAGTLWVGTRGGGLSRLDGGAEAPNVARFTTYSTADGLSNSDIYGIQSDPAGNLWLSSNAGLTRFDPRTLTFRNYSRGDGLQASEFNYNSHYRSATGELYFGGPNGFNAFYPLQLESNPIPPPVVLTGVSVNHRPLATAGSVTSLASLELGHADDNVLFEFAALDYADPTRNRYSYKLDGFDEDWVDLGSERRVSFTNLGAGPYVLRVRAANSDGVWNEEGLRLRLNVGEPPWRTWWAFSLYGVVVLGAAVSFVRFQQRRVEREEAYSHQLEREVGQRTAELEERNAELKRLNIKLLEASLTDSLTGLRNRRFLFDQFATTLGEQQAHHQGGRGRDPQPEALVTAFLMVDLDHFKDINDSCGHAAGDQVLIEVRGILEDCCRSSDVVIRWGGDEFLVIAPDTSAARVPILAERLRNGIESKVFRLGNGQVARTTCSIGFACLPFVRSQPGAVTWEQVVQLADRAMYAAKLDRDAWVGFLGSKTPLDASDVQRMVRAAPQQLVERRGLEVMRSQPRDVGDRSGEGAAARVAGSA